MKHKDSRAEGQPATAAAYRCGSPHPCTGCDKPLTPETAAGLIFAPVHGYALLCRRCRRRAADSEVFAGLVFESACIGCTLPAVQKAFARKGARVPTTPAEYAAAARVLSGASS